MQTLRTRFNGQPVAVCLELKKGPIVSALRNYDFLVLFPVNPLTVAKYREAFTPSRAQDDPTDAELQVEILLKHRDKLTPLSPQSPTMRALAQLVEQRRRLVGDKVRLTNRLTSALKNYFPHVLQWFQEKDTAIFCDFLSHWPTLKAAQLARRATLERFFRTLHIRSADVITTRIEAIKSAVALTTDAGVITPHALLVHALVAQLRVAFGEQRERYASAEELQKYAGIAPVTERSGRWKASAAAGGSAGYATPQPYRWKALRRVPVLRSPLHPLQCLALGVSTPERDDTRT